jgi:hypothetical protein
LNEETEKGERRNFKHFFYGFLFKLHGKQHFTSLTFALPLILWKSLKGGEEKEEKKSNFTKTTLEVLWVTQKNNKKTKEKKKLIKVEVELCENLEKFFSSLFYSRSVWKIHN